MSLLSRILRKEPTPDPVHAAEQPSTADLMTQGNERFQRGDHAAALTLYKRVLEIDPQNARAYYMLGGLAAQDGDHNSALGLIQRAIALRPEAPEFHASLAGLHLSRNQFSNALASFQQALRLKPDSLAYRRAVAGAFLGTGRIAEAVEVYRSISALAPDGAAFLDLGKALHLQGSFQQAEQALLRSIELAPESEEAYMYLALSRRDQGRPVEAEEAARRAVALSEDPPRWFVLGRALADQGRHVEAVAEFRKILALHPDDADAWSSILFSMGYSEQFTPREIFEEHVKYGKLVPSAEPGRIDSAGSSPPSRMRVGYLSPDLWTHPVAYFIKPVLTHHDREKVEVFCYHTGKRADATTEQLKSVAEHWRALPEASDSELERILRSDRLDVLVELSGHTAYQRLAVLARRVAPVQVTYLGYPNTTGVSAVDYRITDASADPPGEADALHVERLVRLPDAFLCYAPPAVAIRPSPPPMLRNGHVTFVSFNNLLKISSATIELWSKTLQAVPDSKLLIKTQGLQHEGLRSLLAARFGAQGVDVAARLTLMPPTADLQEHLQTYSQADIALDPFPYHGTTTTMEALWMGVPVVTLVGDRHASRVGASILSTMGLPELVAQDREQYVQIASQLATAPDMLERLHLSLRDRLLGSPLTDGARFTASLEQAYAAMLRETAERAAYAA